MGGFNRSLAIASLFLLPITAWGEPPPGADPGSPLGLWYRSLAQPLSGLSCCSVADCRPVEARLVGKGWEILVDSTWIAVPPDVVLTRDNPDGRPIACLYAGTIRCFVPPAAT